MGRAARLKRERKEKGPILGGPEIALQNPVASSFPAFIVGNAPHCDYVVEEGSAKGQRLVLCGAGPSLREEITTYAPGADQIWGCNSALPYLVDQGVPVTHGLCVDQTAEMVREWWTAPDVEYLVASTIHPHLTEHLLAHGRKLRWFHNFVGVKKPPVQLPDDEGVMRLLSYEDWLYITLYPGTIRAGSGLNSVTRALDVALHMGFAHIDVLGADCYMRVKSRPPDAHIHSPEFQAWLRNETTMHADGGNALASNQSPLTLGAEIDPGTPDDTVRPGHGRWYQTKIDLVISAVWLVKMEQHHKGRIQVHGDTLPFALRNKTNAYLARLPGSVSVDGKPIEIVVQ